MDPNDPARRGGFEPLGVATAPAASTISDAGQWCERFKAYPAARSWLAAYKYRGQERYRFGPVNGRTGSVQGERPYSTVKNHFCGDPRLIVRRDPSDIFMGVAKNGPQSIRSPGIF